VLFNPLCGSFHRLQWWLTKYIADDVDIFHMYVEMGNDQHTEMLFKFQHSQNPSVSVTTPKVGTTGLNLIAANQAAITQKFWELNEQWQAFA